MIRALFAVFVLSLAGCERGCLTSWFQERGGAPTFHGVPAPAGSKGPPLPLAGIDCSDGLARCTGGMVEVSRAYHYADPCNGSPEHCACPWERIEECAQGCAADGVEGVIPRELAALQLCAPSATSTIAVTPARDAAPPTSCDGEGYFCRGSAIVACGPPPRLVATCLRGCAREGEAIDDEGVTPEGAIAILCVR